MFTSLGITIVEKSKYKEIQSTPEESTDSMFCVSGEMGKA